ncbi:MAG: hypothetical protein NUW24_09185 [Anaerolineae bacterium]|jgi:hypothetical protein|nr:hypothetical protein [Anaerolineae bacterium]MDH7473732.1 hypothetical protein [Anaerolineae bacterium]
MKGSLTRTILALLLILGGILLLLQNLGFLSAWKSWSWTLLFGGGGLLFLAVYASDRKQWWALIPGASLIGVGLLIFLNTMPAVPDEIGVAVMLLCISLAFWIIFLSDRSQWWALIPGGVLIVVALIPLIEARGLSGEMVGGLFFVGLGLVFSALYLFSFGNPDLRWAKYPAIPLLLIGLLIMFAGQLLVWWPLLLILGGLYLLLRMMVGRR